MATKKSSDRGSSSARPEVVHSDGRRQPFLRGIVTHELIQRGVGFDEAYAIARALTDRLSGRGEVSTAELRDLIEQQLEETLTEQQIATLTPEDRSRPPVLVTYGGDAQPFSRGLLAQSLYAAGLDFDRAYTHVLQVQRELREEGQLRIDAKDLALRVGDILERFEGPKVAGRYRLVRQIQRLPKPLVLYIAGASGTGKSTLALDLAPLLRIYRINATDTIRQVMRMVFSPAILPSLHRSSFEPEVDALDAVAELSSDPDERYEQVIRSFEEQATKVCVGVRAVVERSLAENTSVLVEGVHLIPSIVPFADLDSLAYQEMFVLTTIDEEVHRSHFLARRNLRRRRPERYLDHFESIRSQQHYLLHLAEEQHLPMIDTSERDTMVPEALRLVTDLLQRRLPFLAEPPDSDATPTPALLIIIDGLGDRPSRSLGERTPLQAADTPTLDRLAREGLVGLADPVAPGVVPDTASGNLAAFGQSPESMKRGPIEAIGTGLRMEPGDIALRANFATLDERGNLLDRRAGRIREGTKTLARTLDHLKLGGRFADIRVRVRAGTEHRLAIVLHGPGLSSAISGSDPGDAAAPGPPLMPVALDPGDQAATRTAAALREFELLAREALPDLPTNRRRRKAGLAEANAILTRGPGQVHHLAPLAPGGFSIDLSCISGDRTVQGIAAMLGGEGFNETGMTANLDTDLARKFEIAQLQLQEKNLVVLHVKGADIAAHDRRPDLKVEFLQALDRELGEFLKRRRKRLRIAVASDHATISDTGQHAADPVPVLIWGHGVPKDGVERFDEKSAMSGGLRRFQLQLLIEKLFASSKILDSELPTPQRDRP